MQLKLHGATKYLPDFFLAIFFLSFLLFSAKAEENKVAAETKVRGEPILRSDMAVLPPVCQLIFEKPGVHQPVGQVQNAALFERPEYQMAKGNIHLHHYCWGLVEKERYIRARRTDQKNYYFSQAIGDIGYVIAYSDKDWKYFHVMLLEQGNMLLLNGDYPASLTKASQALLYKPGDEKAYILKFDAYKAMGNKKAAIEAAREGLDKNPDSTRLRKRLAGMGIAVPPQTESKPATPKESAVTQETNRIDIAPREVISTPMPTSLPKIEQEGQAVPAPGATTPNNNPYCRFCPAQ